MIYMINTVKAIILKKHAVLMIKKAYENDRVLYTLPGGTQETGENLLQTLRREVDEEVAATIDIIGLAHVYEHSRVSRTQPGTTKHKVEFAFLCTVDDEYEPCIGPMPDANQVATEWIKIDKLSGLNLYPDVLGPILSSMRLPEKPVYMGHERQDGMQ